jgi:hypothetical protein
VTWKRDELGNWAYLPDVAGARADIHGQYGKWYGEEYDQLSDELDTLVGAVGREVIELIKTEFPDPNPLGSLFSPYVGDLIIDRIKQKFLNLNSKEASYE